MQLRKTLHIISLELVKRSVYGQNPPPTYTETPWVTEPPPPQGWLTGDPPKPRRRWHCLELFGHATLKAWCPDTAAPSMGWGRWACRVCLLRADACAVSFTPHNRSPRQVPFSLGIGRSDVVSRRGPHRSPSQAARASFLGRVGTALPCGLHCQP